MIFERTLIYSIDGCFPKLGRPVFSLFVGVLVTRALLFGVCIKAKPRINTCIYVCLLQDGSRCLPLGHLEPEWPFSTSVRDNSQTDPKYLGSRQEPRSKETETGRTAVEARKLEYDCPPTPKLRV